MVSFDTRTGTTVEFDIHEKRFSSADACKAAGITQATLKNWLSRQPGPILLTKEEREEAGSRTRFLLPYLRVLQIALTAELKRLGFALRAAGILASGFTDVGDTPSAWSVDEIPTSRLPGHLYPTGATLLIAYSNETVSFIVNAGHKTSWKELFEQGGYHQHAAVVVNVNTVDTRVRLALGVPL